MGRSSHKFHLAIWDGAVLKKRNTCKYLFERDYLRAVELTGCYLHLDHGDCGINVLSDSVKHKDHFVQSEVEIPRKCSECIHLLINLCYEFYCAKDTDKWSDFHRSLDWDVWKTEIIYVELPPPKVTTRILCQLANKDDLIGFI